MTGCGGTPRASASGWNVIWRRCSHCRRRPMIRVIAGPRSCPPAHTDSGRRTRLGFLCGREAGRLVRHESRRQAMARVADHLSVESVEDLEARLRSAQDPTATRHVQVIWLLARGHTIADVAAV